MLWPFPNCWIAGYSRRPIGWTEEVCDDATVSKVRAAYRLL
jgi:hypothetical protein